MYREPNEKVVGEKGRCRGISVGVWRRQWALCGHLRPVKHSRSDPDRVAA